MLSRLCVAYGPVSAMDKVRYQKQWPEDDSGKPNVKGAFSRGWLISEKRLRTLSRNNTVAGTISPRN